MKKLLAILLAGMMVLLSVSLAAAEETDGVHARDIVIFGHYPQTAGRTDQTPIEWIVLEVKDGKALVISKYGLDAVPYNSEETDVTWEACSLRNWLNSDFLNAAFTPEEQAAIPVTEVDNSASQGFSKYNTVGGNNTQDQVFLLSYAEVHRYFGVTLEDINNTESRVQPSNYALKRGSHTSSRDKTESGAEAGWWWLRSPGFSQNSAACVFTGGSLVDINVHIGYGCVRPVLWIDLESGIFKSENLQDSAAPQTEAEPAGVQAGVAASSVQVGDIVIFGHYPQTAEGTDQPPIEWIVLEVKDGKALVISRYGLDAKPYHTEHIDVTWETCSLRAWLNSDFLNAAFIPEEQAAIPVTEVDNSAVQGYSGWNTDGGNNTQDQVFLLSYAEANRYFGVTREDMDNMKARVQPSDYAISRGAEASSSMTESFARAGHWWLRSPGSVQGSAACVLDLGSMRRGPVNIGINCVRPALWLDLNSEIFRSENPQ